MPARNWIKRRLIAGFFVTVPVFATAWLLWIFWVKIDDLFDPFYRTLFGRPIPGLGFLTAVGIIFVVGTIATNVVGRRVLALADKLLMRVPVYRRLYPSVKQLIESFSPEKRSSFKEVVLAEHPRKGEWTFGFVTSELVVDGPDGKRDMVTVFVPTNNLYLGRAPAPAPPWPLGLRALTGSRPRVTELLCEGADRLPQRVEPTEEEVIGALDDARAGPG